MKSGIIASVIGLIIAIAFSTLCIWTDTYKDIAGPVLFSCWIALCIIIYKIDNE